MDIKEVIEDIFEKYELNGEKLANKLGVTRSFISALKNGREKPSIRFLKSLLTGFPEYETLLNDNLHDLYTSKLKSYKEHAHYVRSLEVENNILKVKNDGLMKENLLLKEHVSMLKKILSTAESH